MASRNKALKLGPGGELYIDESDIQRNCVRWFRIVHREIALLLFSIPNGAQMGGKRSKTGHAIQASVMIGEGLTAGVADLFLSVAASGLHGLYIEMKTPVGKWDKEQREFAARVVAQGYGYCLCRTRDAFEKEVEAYLKGTYVQAKIIG